MDRPSPSPLVTSARNEYRRVQLQLLAVQVMFSALFCSGVIFGFIEARAVPAPFAVGVVASYQLTFAAYVLFVRLRDPRFGWIEACIPGAIVTCIGFAWVSTGDLMSPIWAILPVFVIGYAGKVPLVPYKYFIPYAFAVVVGATLIIHATSSEALSLSTTFVIWALSAGVSVAAAMTVSQLVVSDREARSLAETDSLTGVANRRRFFSHLESIANQKSAEPFAILMMDLDNFKRLNDTRGHVYGDATLASAAQVSQRCLREGDVLARYGGEEFAALLYGADAHAALAVAERIRARVAEETPTSVSIGVATSADGTDPTTILQLADEQLLLAKRSGKNLVRMRPGWTNVA